MSACESRSVGTRRALDANATNRPLTLMPVPGRSGAPELRCGIAASAERHNLGAVVGCAARLRPHIAAVIV